MRSPYGIDGWRVDVANMLGRQGESQLGHKVGRGMRKAVKQENPPDPGEIEARIAALMEYYAIREQRLHSLLHRLEMAGSAAQAR